MQQSILFGDFLIKKKRISEEQLQLALESQRKIAKPIGEVLVQLGFLKIGELSTFLQEHNKEYNNYQESIAQLDYLEETTDEQAQNSKSPINRVLSHKGFGADIIGVEKSNFFRENEVILINNVKKKWKEVKFSTNLVIIDIQHSWLIMLVCYLILLHRNFKNQTKTEELIKILNECNIYAQRHFKVEEILLSLLQNNFNSHKIEHQNFLKKLEENKRKYEDSDFRTSSEINYLINTLYETLNNWLLSHISINDKNYALALKRRPDKKEILQKWVYTLKKANLLEITAAQKKFYDAIIV